LPAAILHQDVLLRFTVDLRNAASHAGSDHQRRIALGTLICPIAIVIVISRVGALLLATQGHELSQQSIAIESITLLTAHAENILLTTHRAVAFIRLRGLFALAFGSWTRVGPGRQRAAGAEHRARTHGVGTYIRRFRTLGETCIAGRIILPLTGDLVGPARV